MLGRDIGWGNMCDKDVLIVATDYYMYFYIIVLFPFYSFTIFSLLINAVILLLNCLV